MRTLVVGDVHGCLEELRELLSRASYRRGVDRLVLLGDLMDRGPHPVECVRLAREVGAECILGNHEEKHLRWRRHRDRAAAEPGYKNPMAPMLEPRESENARLDSDDVAWLRSLPVCLDLGDGWVAVHGGFEPARSLGEQKDDRVLRMRWVDGGGRYLPLKKGRLDRPQGARYWAELWEGPLSVVYGHAVHSLSEPRVDRAPSGVECWGLDTGCCFGGHLTALELPSMKVHKVAARARYAELAHDVE